MAPCLQLAAVKEPVMDARIRSQNIVRVFVGTTRGTERDGGRMGADVAFRAGPMTATGAEAHA